MSLRPIKPFGLQWIKIEPIRVNHARPDSSSCIGVDGRDARLGCRISSGLLLMEIGHFREHIQSICSQWRPS